MGERFLINRVISKISDLKDYISMWDEERWYLEEDIYMAF
jgi:hypothetical protein